MSRNMGHFNTSYVVIKRDWGNGSERKERYFNTSYVVIKQATKNYGRC